MKCKVCGGSLSLNDNLYVCMSCNNHFPIESVYENVDVFIAYKENDEQGRRTKDSIIAQDIYNKLSNSGVECFYQRISADHASGVMLESITDYAISKSKIIVLVGTNQDVLNHIIQKYRSFFENKKILPVYSDIEAYNLPQELRSLQALNYKNIGAGNDLAKIVLHTLNKDDEFNIVDLNAEMKQKRTIKIILLAIVIIVLIASGVCYFIFGTTNVLPGKKYEAAIKEMNACNYVKAIEMFSEISAYKDSSAQLKQIYNQYNGYYYNEKENIAVHINITDNIKAIVEIRKLTGKGDIIIKESSEVDLNKIAFGFNDSENNQGSATITLLNNNIDLNITTERKAGTLSFEDVDVSFDISGKADKPLTKEVDYTTLKKWLSEKHTLSNIKSEGYDLIYITGDSITKWKRYNISNTDVMIDFICGEFSDSNHLSKGETEEIAYVFTVPAELIVPDKIGKKCMPFIKGNDMFLPNANFSNNVHGGMSFEYSDEIDVIEKDTLVACLSKAVLSNDEWNTFLEDYIYSYYLNKEYEKKYGGYGKEYFSFVAENDTHYLATVSYNFNNPLTPMYKINKSTYETEFICEIPYSAPNHNKNIYLEDYPQYFSEFINYYLFPSNSKYITASDLQGKSAEQVALIRNEIFARHGYIFETEPYRTYFNQKSWYVPNYDFDWSMLNSIEKENVDFITKYEKEME